MKIDKKVLKEVGLTEQEARAYKSLLHLGSSKATDLSKEANITTSNIYGVLEKLGEKGLVNFQVKNKVKTYFASHPRVLKELLSEKRNQIRKQEANVESLIETFEAYQRKPKSKSNYKYFEGVKGVKAMWHELNNIMDSDHEFTVFACKPGSYERFVGFYDEHHKKREEKGVFERIIIPDEDKELGEKRRNDVTDFRYLKLENEAEWGVTKDYLYIIYIVTDTPRSFLIKDRVIADTYHHVFDIAWKSAKER